MYFTSDFKKGLFIEMDGVPYQIVEFQHVKPGKGNAFVRTRLKNLLTNNVIDRTLKSGEKVGEPDLEHKRMQYLYSDGSGFQFMDLDSYEQVLLESVQVGDAKYFLTENLEIEVLYYQGKPIALELPNFVFLKVKYTEPGIKGDTVSGGGKPATMSTDLTVTVPFHISIGDALKIDTRTGDYVEKVK
ncbi:MAG: elongation factor P [Deltaproteobacteria bacterium]|nr:elongation factor P [Deltaproteobacteria bacterium]